MTPILLSDPPRIPGPRPDGDAKPVDDRPGTDDTPAAFLAAMGLIPGPTAPPSPPPAQAEAVGQPPAGPDPVADPVADAPARSAAAPPCCTCDDTAAVAIADGTAGPEDARPAPAAPVSAEETAFLASGRRTEAVADGGTDAEATQAGATPGNAATAADIAADPAGPPRPHGQPVQGHPPRTEPAPGGAVSDGQDQADGAPADAGARSAAVETAAAPAMPPGARPAGRARSEAVGAVDPLSATPGAIGDLATGADPAQGARVAERAHPATPGTAQLPAGFGHRLAEVVATFPDRAIELTLSPEELGRVRMTLATHDGTLTLSVQADRQKTIDLMRRHIDQLAQDFRDLGFTDLNFTFGSGNAAPGGGEERPTGDPATNPAPATPARTPAAPGGNLHGRPGGGLDLRL